jgi:hypothetical protein
MTHRALALNTERAAPKRRISVPGTEQQIDEAAARRAGTLSPPMYDPIRDTHFALNAKTSLPLPGIPMPGRGISTYLRITIC